MTNFKELLVKFYKEYKYLLLLIYFPLYLAWFMVIEKLVTDDFYVIHMAIDDYIPFCEYFIIPYLMWFGYIAIVVLYTGFTNKKEFFKMCAFLYTGMTVFLIVSTVFPNGHLLRPVTFEHDNIFTQLCAGLYQTDTATNLFPSVHVYNSIGAHLAVANNEKTKNNHIIRLMSGILSVTIIISTVFTKQHSVFDVLTAFALALVMYIVVYKRDKVFASRKATQKTEVIT